MASKGALVLCLQETNRARRAIKEASLVPLEIELSEALYSRIELEAMQSRRSAAEVARDALQVIFLRMRS